MAHGDKAAEQYEKDQPSEYGLLSDDARKRLLSTIWNSRLNTARRAREVADEAEQSLWNFMEQHAYRGVERPYEVCGNEDAWHPRHDEGHPEYDEDDLVPSAICQLPRNHRDLGYRNHLEMKNGQVWGAWS
jgi:hypothetical protein